MAQDTVRRCRGTDESRESTRSRSPIGRSSLSESARDASPVNFSAALDSEDKNNSQVHYWWWRWRRLTEGLGSPVPVVPSGCHVLQRYLQGQSRQVTQSVQGVTHGSRWQWSHGQGLVARPAFSRGYYDLYCTYCPGSQRRWRHREDDVVRDVEHQLFNFQAPYCQTDLSQRTLQAQDPQRCPVCFETSQGEWLQWYEGSSVLPDVTTYVSWYGRVCQEVSHLCFTRRLDGCICHRGTVSQGWEDEAVEGEVSHYTRGPGRSGISRVCGRFQSPAVAPWCRVEEFWLPASGFVYREDCTIWRFARSGSRAKRTSEQADRMAGASVTFALKHRETKSRAKATSSRKIVSRTSVFDRLGSPAATTTQRTVTQEPPFRAGAGRGAHHRPYPEARKKSGKSSGASSTRQRWRVPGGGSPGRLCPALVESAGQLPGHRHCQGRGGHTIPATTSAHPSVHQLPDQKQLARPPASSGCLTIEGGHRAGHQRDIPQVLQPVVPGPKEDRRSAACDRSLHSQPSHGSSTLQDGDARVHPFSHQKSGGDSFDRHPRCLPSCSDAPGRPQVSALRGHQASLPVHLPSFRFSDIAPTVHQTAATSRSAVKAARCEATRVLRRLADQSRYSRTGQTARPDDHQCAPVSRLDHQLREVRPHSKPRLPVHRDAVQHSTIHSGAPTKDASRSPDHSSTLDDQSEHHGQRSAQISRHSGVHGFAGTTGKTSASSCPVVGRHNMVPENQELDRPDRSSSVGTVRSGLVGISSSPARFTPRRQGNGSDSLHGCVQFGLGSPVRLTLDMGTVVSISKIVAHQRSGDAGRHQRRERLPASSEVPGGSLDVRQHSDCGLHQERGRHKIAHFDADDHTTAQVVQPQGDYVGSRPSARSPQHPGGFPVQSRPDTEYGVDDGHGASMTRVCQLGWAEGRLVCDIRQQTTHKICIVISGPQGRVDRRHVNALGQREGPPVCVPAIQDGPSSSAEDRSVTRSQGDSDRSTATGGVMISGVDGSVPRRSDPAVCRGSRAADSRRFDGQRNDGHSSLPAVKSTHVETLPAILRAKGHSREAARMMSRSLRDSKCTNPIGQDSWLSVGQKDGTCFESEVIISARIWCTSTETDFSHWR